MIVSYENYKLAQAVYEEFSLKQHSRHIATLSALACLAQTLTLHKPKRVVELGGGIGTITALMGRHPDRPPLLMTLEDSPLCLPSLKEVFGEYAGRGWEIISTPAPLVGLAANLLIVDGYCNSNAELGVIKDSTMVFFEGNRGPERERVRDWVLGRGLKVTITEHKLTMRDQDVEGKGCWIGRVLRG